MLQSSRVNRKLAEAAKAIEGVTFHDLYELYPDFDVDVRRQQALSKRTTWCRTVFCGKHRSNCIRK